MLPTHLDTLEGSDLASSDGRFRSFRSGHWDEMCSNTTHTFFLAGSDLMGSVWDLGLCIVY